MPRYVDHDVRRQQIAQATVETIAERGAAGLSFRAIAHRMGGSSTLITHFYPTQKSLLDAVLAYLIDEYDREVLELDAEYPDQRERLRALLLWLVPMTPRRRMLEQARVQFLALHLSGRWRHPALGPLERKMRRFLRLHVEGLVPDETVDSIVDFLRAATNGVTLTTLEHPDVWDETRQVELVEQLMAVVADQAGPGA